MNRFYDFDQLVVLCQRTHNVMVRQSVRTVDSFLVVRNWLFGRYIIEFEQKGAGRGELYGKNLIERLAASLKTAGLRGVSPTNLRKFREFYTAYPEIRQTSSVTSQDPVQYDSEIQQTLSVISSEPEFLSKIDGWIQEHSAALTRYFPLGWSHYVILLSVNNPDERRFFTKLKPSVIAGVSVNSSARSPVHFTNVWPSAVTRKKYAAYRKKDILLKKRRIL